MSKTDPARRAASLAMIGMAAGGLLAVVVAFAGDWHWFADLLSHLRPQYCVWLGAAWCGGMWLRVRVAVLLASAGLILNAIALAPYAWSWAEPERTSAAERVWTVASVNLLQGNKESGQVVRYLHETQADIVVLQEVSDRWAAKLDVLRDLYPYRLVQPSKDQFGVALFSREKPVTQSVAMMGERKSDLAVFGTWAWEGRRFSVAGIHPDKPDERWKTLNRATYFERLAQWSEERQRRVRPWW